MLYFQRIVVANIPPGPETAGCQRHATIPQAVAHDEGILQPPLAAAGTRGLSYIGIQRQRSLDGKGGSAARVWHDFGRFGTANACGGAILPALADTEASRFRIATNGLAQAESDTLAARALSVATLVRLSLLLAGLWIPQLVAQPPGIEFGRDIEPIFRERCIACHGPANQSGGLRLDHSAVGMRGGNSGVVIKVGDGSGSRLVQMLSRPASQGPVMPLGGERLSSEQIKLITAWIDQGAQWSDSGTSGAEPSRGAAHWSFAPPARPEVPQARASAWVRNPIDSFVAAKLESQGIEPSPEAPPAVLLRRLSLDLIGIPPSPGEVAAFAGGEVSLEQAAERLLASPHAGEMDALHWLDQARFGESDGYQADYIRPYAWRWRHWVIDAFNRNLGFDRFTVEQVAGDLIPSASLGQVVATGFHRNALRNREGGFPLEMDRVERAVERTSTVATVWLGLTVGCARCHDHKFDPISQSDFYGLYAFFNTAIEHDIDAPLAGERRPYLARRPEFERRRTELFRRYRIPELQAYWETRILAAASKPSSGLEPIWRILWDLLQFELDGGAETVRTASERRTAKQSDLLSAYFVTNVVGGYDFQTPEGFENLDFAELKREFKALQEQFPALTQANTMADNPAPPETRILVRGDYRNPGIPVAPSAPSALPPLPAGRPDRLALARWLVSADNPLTARVAVNRIWQRYFGTGLVATSDDFGTRGERPSHPDLLDWLAVEFMESGWDAKALSRLIVTSATYRQSSDVRRDLSEIDPANRLLARQSRIRLPAEIIRDSAFAAAGVLDRRIGGESVRPYLPAGATEIGFGDFVKWPQSEGADKFRRGLYIFRQRTLPYPQLETFDAPDTVQPVCQRDRSTTPLQALTLLNDPVFEEAAKELGARVQREGGSSVNERLRYAFRLCVAREPNTEELNRLAAYHGRQRQILIDEARESESTERAEPAAGTEDALWAAVASVLLNLVEFVTRS